MALTKLGKYIDLLDLRNSDNAYSADSVVGLSTQKLMITTKADLSGVSITSYKLFPPKSFAYVPDTSRRGDKVSLAYNNSSETYLVSSISIVFTVSAPDSLLSDYLYMYFNRPEFDRYARFNSWGSTRETFSWEEMCDIDIDLPPISVQQKYVDIYNAMLENQRCYERGLEDLKLVFEGYFDKLRHTETLKSIGQFIELVGRKNENLEYGLESVRGVSIKKEFIDTKADMTNVKLKPYYVIKPNEFAYVPVTSRNGEKISLAINDTEQTIICSSSYVVFRCIDENILLPQYLMLYFSRSDFNRYARFNSWGSTRETFNYEDMCDVKIPIPEIKIQQYMVNVYIAIQLRKEINEQLKQQIRDICPILIKGAVEEGERE